MTGTLLLVEDSITDAELFGRMLKKFAPEIRLLSVPDGFDAILYLQGRLRFANRANYPVPELIVLDLRMPVISGFQFLEWLRRDAPAMARSIPVLVLSGVLNPADQVRATALGANACMAKPTNWAADMQPVVAVIERLLAGARTRDAARQLQESVDARV